MWSWYKHQPMPLAYTSLYILRIAHNYLPTTTNPWSNINKIFKHIYLSFTYARDSSLYNHLSKNNIYPEYLPKRAQEWHSEA